MISIEGNAGSPAKAFVTGGGKIKQQFSVAHSSGTGERKSTVWFNVECWDKYTQEDSQKVAKGDRVIVEGELGHYEGKEQRTIFTIRASKVRRLAKFEPATAPQHDAAPPIDVPQDAEQGSPDEELPF